MAQPCDMDLWVMKWRSAWTIFHGPVILPCILKTIWHMYIILSEYESVWPDIWPQNKCRSLWPIFHGPVIVPNTLKAFSCMNIIIRDLSLWPIFHSPVILCYILKTIWCMNIILGDYGSEWPDVWPQMYVTVTCISWFTDFALYLRLFDGWVSYFQITKQGDTNFDLKINSQCDLYFMV